MNPIVKSAWVAALRSGEYRQAKRSLRGYNPGEFCCLGVLCDLHAKATGEGWAAGVYLGQREVLPRTVLEWAGLSAYSPNISLLTKEDGLFSLSSLNDSGEDFTYIADVIEQHL